MVVVRYALPSVASDSKGIHTYILLAATGTSTILADISGISVSAAYDLYGEFAS